MPNDFDVFVSYSSKDRDWVDSFLLPHLEQSGLKVCIDYRDFAIGLPAIENMARAVEKSQKVMLVLTPHWMSSEWASFEALLSQTLDPSGFNRKTIPLMLQNCDLPLRIRFLTYADFRDTLNWDIEIRRLVRSLLGQQ